MKQSEKTSSNTPLLDNIESPSDLRKLNKKDLASLCEELRYDLINTVSQVGGHFASSLGVVELTVALHYMFDTPEDRVVWDVGHQAYIHKILTGRRKDLPRVRQYNGISGFPKRDESQYDTFGVAHAGTSISAAVGMLEASSHECSTNKNRQAIAVIGDGAMTAGMAFEALNHSGHLHKRLIVILNDNEMSIAPNVGALSRIFSRAVTNTFSTSARKHVKNLRDKGFIPETFYKALDRAEEAALGFFSAPAMLFNSFGYRYIGPIDGHNISQVISALERAKNQDGPVLIHALTTKGKGYEPAEIDPVKYHGVGPFEVNDGKFIKPVSNSKKVPTYTEVYGNTLVELAKSDNKIVGITAAMPDGTGLSTLQEEMPERYYDVGICEQHGVTFAAGLACEGMKPFCTIYSTFLQRAFDQVIHDVCIQSLPVIFAMDRAGLVGADGATHHGVFDISYLRSLPNMTIMAPKDEKELRDMMYTASKHKAGPIAFRYPRGSAIGVDINEKPKEIEIGKAELLKLANPDSEFKVLLLGLGQTVYPCLEASKTLLVDHHIESSIVNARFVKPLDTSLLAELINSHQLIVSVEDHAIQGGFGSAILEFISDYGLSEPAPMIRLGIEDRFINHGTQKELYRECKYDTESIVNAVLKKSPIHSNSELTNSVAVNA